MIAVHDDHSAGTSALCGIDQRSAVPALLAQGIRVQRDDSGIWTYLFGSAYGDFFYQIDGGCKSYPNI